MWFIDLFFGWSLVGKGKSLEEVKNLKKSIIKIAEKKGSKISDSVAGNQWKKGNRFLNPRGQRLANSIPRFKFHIQGKNFVYRIYTPKMICADVGGNGHYGYLSKGKYIVLSKKK